MADQLLKNKRAEQEADRIGAQFAGSNDVVGDMGKAFNYDFSNVNLHGGAEGERMAASHGDLAYAQGNNAYFGADILNKHTPEANMAVGHELTHVMQQNDGAGVSEHVPFGESQGLGFFGKIKRFFRNLFSRKKKGKADDRATTADALTNGRFAEVTDMSKSDWSTESEFTDANREELNAEVTGVNWEAEKERQEEEKQTDTESRFYENGTATEAGARVIKATEGYRIAIMLLENTPLWKKLSPIVQGARSELRTRLFLAVRPVYLDEKGDFATERDKQNNDWNMQYLKSLSGNFQDTSIVEGYIDEILSMESIVEEIATGGEAAMLRNMEAYHRMGIYTLTFDFYKNTKIFQEYLKANNGGVLPSGENNWPIKAKAAAKLCSAMGTLGYMYSSVQGKNGLNGEAYMTHFSEKSRDLSRAKSVVPEEVVLPMVQSDLAEYKVLKSRFESEGGIVPKQATNSDYAK